MALNPKITPLPSITGPLYVGPMPLTTNTTNIAPYLPLVTWKETLNKSAASISDQQLSVAAQNQPIPIIYGQTRVGPKLAYVYSALGLLYVLGVWCHGPVDSIVTKWADDSTTSTALAVTEDFLGSTTQSPSTFMAQILSGYGTSSTLTGVTCTGVLGQFSYTGGGVLAVGQTVTITGTCSGSLTMEGYVPPGPQIYYVVTTDKISTFTLSLTYNGAGIITTGSTSTGLSFVGTKDRLTSPPICYSVFKISPTTTGTTPSYTFPRYNYLIKGLKVYDPRTGLTEWSDNPALCLADFITNSIYGCGYDIDWDSVATVADLNDSIISTDYSGVTIGANSGTFSYTGGVSLSVGDTVRISGTLTGSATIDPAHYTTPGPQTYYVISTDGTSYFRLSMTLGGGWITTTAGTITGLTVSKVEKHRTLNLVLINPQDSISWIDTLRTYAGCWVSIIGGVVKLMPDAVSDSEATYSHTLGNLLNINNISKRGVMDVPNWLTLEHTDNTVVPYRTRPAIIDNSNGGTLKESTVSMPGINRYSQAYREAIERLNKLNLNDLSFDLEIFDEGIKAELGDVIGVIHPIGIGSTVSNLALNSEGSTGWTASNTTILPNDILSVRSTLTVPKLSETTATDQHAVFAPTATIVAGTTCTTSIEIKPNGRIFVGLTPDAGGNCGVALHSAQGFQVIPVTITGVVCTAAGGPGWPATFTCTSSTLFVGQMVTINGAMTGVTFSPGYVSGTTYTIFSTDESTTFTLVDTNGLPIYCNTTGSVGVSTFIAPVQKCRLMGTLLEANITELTSGFYRLKVAYVSKSLALGGSNTVTPRLYLSDISEVTDSSIYTYTGDTAKGVWYTALQIETGTYVNTYTPSYSTSTTTLYPKLMRILGMNNTSPGRYTLRCVEYDPAVYSTALVTTPTYTDTPTVDSTVVSFTGSRLVINNSASTTTLQALAPSL